MYSRIIPVSFHHSSFLIVPVFLTSKNAKQPLAQKGFHFIFTTTENEFMRQLKDVDVAWIVSGDVPVVRFIVISPILATLSRPTYYLGFPFLQANAQAFANACKTFHTSGGALFIWADNSPFVQHANVVLQELFQVRIEIDHPSLRMIIMLFLPSFGVK